MIGELCFTLNDTVYPTYVLDACGNLVRCAGDQGVDGLIAGASEVVSTRNDLANPVAWTLTVAAVEARLGKLIKDLPDISKAYTGLKVPTVPFPFAAKIECSETDDMVARALDVVAAHGESEASKVIEYLSTLGIFRIPRIAKYNAAIHEPADGTILGDEVDTRADGWYSHMKIYRKSVVS